MSGFYQEQVLDFLKTISVPRPNHSKKLSETAELIKQQLRNTNIPYLEHPFTLRPHKSLLVGFTLLGLAILYSYLLINQRYLSALFVTILIAGLLVVEFEIGVFLVSRLISKAGENISATFSFPDATKELILCAHFDSKTDFLNPVLQSRIQKLLLPVIAGGLVIPAILEGVLMITSSWQFVVEIVGFFWGACFISYWIYVALSLGGYIFIKHKQQSSGTIDNATSVAALLSVAETIKHNRSKLNANITLLFTCGEESSGQGSLAYLNKRIKRSVAKREPKIYLLNLESIGQSGDIITWKKYGTLFRSMSGDEELTNRLARVVEDVAGKPLSFKQKTTDDAVNFLTNGIPAISIAHSGYPIIEGITTHTVDDNINLYDPVNFRLMVQVILRFIEDFK